MKKRINIIACIPILVLFFEILLRFAGYGPNLDQFVNQVNYFKEESLIEYTNYSEKSNFREDDLIGIWKSDNVSLDGRPDAKINLKLYSNNYYSLRISSKDSKDSIKKGSYFIRNNCISFVPTTFKDKGKDIPMNSLINHIDQYAEGYTFELNKDNLILTNVKTEEVLSFNKK